MVAVFWELLLFFGSVWIVFLEGDDDAVVVASIAVGDGAKPEVVVVGSFFRLEMTRRIIHSFIHSLKHSIIHSHIHSKEELPINDQAIKHTIVSILGRATARATCDDWKWDDGVRGQSQKSRPSFLASVFHVNSKYLVR